VVDGGAPIDKATPPVTMSTMRVLPRTESGLVLVTFMAAAMCAPACGSSSKSASCVGAVRCDCYPNHTCDNGLACFSNMCVADPGGSSGGATVPLTGTGGAIAATGGATANPGAGGAIAATGGATVNPGAGGTAVIPGGTGGSVVVGSGGAVTPTGGAVSTGGTTGTTSPYITAKDGWATDAAHQVQGSVYTYTDAGGSNIYPICTVAVGATATCFKGTGTTTQFCASGTVAQALTPGGANCELTSDSCDWSSYWGAALAMNLNQSPEAADGVAWNGSSYSGVSFDIAIAAIAANLRLYVNLVDGTQYCYAVSSSKTYTLSWSQFRRDCYTTGGATLSGAALSQIKSLAWQSGTDASLAHAYDFCVDHVKIN